MFDVSETSYDNFMGRFSMPLGPVFADFAGISSGSRVLDVGAGTGALTAELVRRGARVAAVDPSRRFVEALGRRFPELEIRDAPAEELPWPDETFDAALAQLVLTFMRDAPAGLAEMRRVVRPGGTVAVCMWDRTGMEMLAAVERTQGVLDPSRPTSEQLTTYRTRAEIEQLVGDGAELALLEVDAGYAGFDELWDAIVDGAGPAGAWAKSLGAEQRIAAREELYRQVGEPRGSFTLRGRAWAARVNRA
ncbi:MAG: class I SAM-dependent methyltransferase [Gaiellaceae bacterium]